MLLDLEYMAGLVPVILRYVPLTLGMAVAAMAIALLLAAVFAVIRVLKVPVLDRLVAVFISFFRGTPLLVQLFLFYYGLPQVVEAFRAIDGVTAAIIGLTYRAQRKRFRLSYDALAILALYLIGASLLAR